MEGNTEIQKMPAQRLPENKSSESSWFKGLKNRFNQVFGKEKKDGVPKIEVDIFFAPHGTGKDLGGFEKHFASCDIFVPEAFGWDLRGLEFCKNASFGKGELQELTKKFEEDFSIKISSYWLKTLEIIFNSKKPITIIDLPASYPDIQRYIKDFEYAPVVASNFSEVLDYTKDKMRKRADGTLEREDYMLLQFRPKIEELLKAYPYLKQKERIKILLTLGASHTSFYQSLKNKGENVTRSFRRMPTIYAFSSEASRRYLFGKNVDDELAAKVFLEQLVFGNKLDLETSIQLVQEDTHKFIRFQRKICSQFSFGEAKELFEGIEQEALYFRGLGIDSEEVSFESYISDWFHNKLKDKGLRIPDTEEELDEFLAKPIISYDKNSQDNTKQFQD